MGPKARALGLWRFVLDSVSEARVSGDPEFFKEADCALKLLDRTMKGSSQAYAHLAVMAGLFDLSFEEIASQANLSSRDHDLDDALARIEGAKEWIEQWQP